MSKKKVSWLNKSISNRLSNEKKFNKLKHRMFLVLTFLYLSKFKSIKTSMKQLKTNWSSQNSNSESKSTNQKFHIMLSDIDFRKLLIRLMSWAMFQRKTLNLNQSRINYKRRFFKCKAPIENFHKFFDNRKLYLSIYKKVETLVEIHL